MRLRWQRLRPGELDHELIWLAVTSASAGATAIWLALHLPWPRCTFRAVLGIPCPTCGATRAALAFFHGEFAAAWHFNPLATLAYFGIALFDLYALGILISGAPRLRFTPLPDRPRRIAGMLVVSAALVNWIYLLHTN